MMVSKKKIVLRFIYMILALCLFTGMCVARDSKKSRAHAHVPHYAHALKPQDIKKLILSNGMTILVYENHTVPKVHLHLAYGVGSAVEQSGERGLAHLIEHMIFKGTHNLKESDIDAIARKYGATYNAQTMHDVTSYYFEVDKENWRPFVSILADCMMNARFNEEHLASEMKAVLAELAMTNDDYWHFMLERALTSVFAANHPYYVPIIGYKEDLMAMTAERLHKFYDKYYVPSRATLFIVGDINADEALACAQEQFGTINAETLVQTPSFPPNIFDVTAQKTIYYRDIQSPFIAYYWRVPGMQDENSAAFEALELIIGQSKSSRLHRAMIDQEQCASGVSSAALLLKHAGIFVILVQPHEDKFDECRRLVTQEIKKIIEKGVTRAELVKAHNMKQREFLAEQEQFDDLTTHWILSYMATGDEHAYFTGTNDLAALTPEDMRVLVQSHLNPEQMHEIVIMPATDGQRAQLQKNKDASDLLDAAILAAHARTSPVEKPSYVHTLPPPIPLDVVLPKPDAQYTLKNGLAVIVRGGTERNLFSMRLSFRDAYRLLESSDGLLVSLLTNMLMEGTRAYSKQELVDFFEEHGAKIEVDERGVLLEGLVEHIPELLKRVAHMLEHPQWTSDALEKIKAIACDYYTRMSSSQRDLALRLVYNAMYPNHPFCWTYAEASAQMKAITSEDLKKLYQTYITPSRMILAMVGGFDTASLKQDIARAFGLWSGSDYVPLPPRKEPQITEQKFIDHTMVRDQVLLAFAKGSHLTVHHPDLVPMMLLNSMCFRGLGSRLYQLREDSGLFYTASGHFGYPPTPEHGINLIWTLLAPDKLEEVEKRIRALVADIAQNGVTETELACARQLFLKQIIIDSAHMDALTQRYIELVAYDVPIDFFDQCYKRAQSITLQEINDVARKYFSTDGMTRFRVGVINGQNSSDAQTP